MRTGLPTFIFLSLFSLLAACSSTVEHEAPFDAQSPLSKQKKGTLVGKVELTGESDHGQVAVTATGSGFTSSVQTLDDGSFRIAPVTPGPLSLTFTFRGFQSEQQAFVLGIGENLDVGTVSLAPKAVKVTGSALAETQSAAGGTATAGGVVISAVREGGVKDISAKAPAWRMAAAGGSVASSYATVSDGGGDYTLTLPAGQYMLTASKEGAPSQSLALAVNGEADVSVDPLTLRPLAGLVSITGVYGTGPTTSTEFSASRDVGLTLLGFNAAQMRVAEAATCPSAVARTFAASLAFQLTAGDGAKTVCARFLNEDQETDDITASIVLDTTKPSGTVALNGGVPYLTAPGLVAMSLAASDSLSGVATMQIAASNDFSAAPEVPYETTKVQTIAAPDGPKTFWVRFRDRAGNFSDAVSATVILDSTAPVGGFSVNGGADYAATQFVTVAATGNADVATLELSNDGTVFTPFTFANQLVWALSPVAGPQTVYARFVDLAGNRSVMYTDAVTYDTQAPVVTSFSLDVTRGAAALRLAWASVPLPGVQSYRWYRIRDGVATLGGSTATTSATVAVPLDGESYAVAATYADGLESALSSPAAETALGVKTKSILVVDDDGATLSVESNLLPLLVANGFPFDVTAVALGSDGPSAATLNDYAVVIWSTGETAKLPLLSGSDRAVVRAYLESGGNFLLLSPQSLVESNSATFLKGWSHVGRVELDIDPVGQLDGVAGDPVGAGAEITVGPHFVGADALYGSPVAAPWLEAGKPLAVRYPASGSAAYRFAYAGIQTTGLFQRNVADLNTASLDVPFSGVNLTMGDDTAVALQLPFAFHIGTYTGSSVYVGANGTVAFGAPVTAAEPWSPFPATEPGMPVLAAMWQDLHPETAGAVYVVTGPTSVEIVWSGVPSAMYAGQVTVSVRLHDDSSFDLVMRRIEAGPGLTLFTGFQDGTGRDYEAMGFPFKLGFPYDCTFGCGVDPFAISIRSFKDTIAESAPMMGRLVRWLAAPSAMQSFPVRYYAVSASVADDSGVAEMLASSDGVIDTEIWQAYQASLPVTFAAGDGAKTVKVIYRDEAGNQTTVNSDTRTLDTQAPRISAVLLTDANSGSNAFSRTRTVTMQIVGDAASSDYMRASENPAYVDAGWTPYAESSTFTLSENDGPKLIYVWLKDANGNVSAPAVGAIEADTEAPVTKAIAARISNQAPIYVNASYREYADAETFGALAPGTRLGVTSEIPVTALKLPFSFPYYGRSRQTLVVYKNGVVALDLIVSTQETDPGKDKADREKSFLAGALVAPLFQPLALSKSAHGVYYYESPLNDFVTLRWVGEDPRTQAAVNVALKLYADGRIRFLYGEGNLDVDAVVGIHKGDGKNFVRSRYDEARFLSQASSVEFEPNGSDVDTVSLYYRYRYAAGPGNWIDSGAAATSVFEAIAFYPMFGPGEYEFYTQGIDSAGNAEDEPALADAKALFDDQRPSAPTNVQADADDDGVFVRWDGSKSSDVVGYLVYYGSDAGFKGDDAIEGRSPVYVEGETETRLSGLSIGQKVFVTVTAVDHVGIESFKPGGAGVVPPRALRRLASVALAEVQNVRLQGAQLFVRNFPGTATELRWYDLSDPASPQLRSTMATGGFGLALWGRRLFSSDVSYSVTSPGTFSPLSETAAPFSGANPFDGGYYMAPVSSESLLLMNNTSSSTSELERLDLATAAYQPLLSLAYPLGVVAERNTALAFEGLGCTSFGGCTSGYGHVVTLAAATGIAYPSGVSIATSFAPTAFDLANGYLALGDDYSQASGKGVLEIHDLSVPTAPARVYTGSTYNPMAVRWIGDRLAFGDYFGLGFLSAGDVTNPVVESFVGLNGFPRTIDYSGTLAVAGLSTGFDVVEMGELLPGGVRNQQVALAGQITALATAGDYVYVAEESRLDVFDIANVQTAGPVLVGRFTPFVGMALAVRGDYLFAVDSAGLLSVFDVSQPATPALLWTEPESVHQTYGWPTPDAPLSLVLFGPYVFLNQRAYDVTDPRNPMLEIDYKSQAFAFLRSGEGLLYAAASTDNVSYDIWIFEVTRNGEISVVGRYGPITYLADFAVDGRALYVYQKSPVGMLSVVDAGGWSAPVKRGEFPVGDLGWAPSNRYLAAARGFVYLAIDAGGVRELLQFDMRDPGNPVIAFKYTGGGGEFINPPYAVSSRDVLLAAGSRTLSSFRISSAVPVRESHESAQLGGVEHVALGGRFGFFSRGSEIFKTNRRSPALVLTAVGGGELAVTKKGSRLQVYDPPGIPAAALTEDRSGAFDLRDARYDRAEELCAALASTGRIACRLGAGGFAAGLSSERILDNFGLRLVNDEAGAVQTYGSLFAPQVVTSATLGGIVSALRYADGRLFAAVKSGVGGMYVIDPDNLSAVHHAVGGFAVHSLQIVDDVAYLGRANNVAAYKWPKGQLISNLATAVAVTTVTVNYDRLYYHDFQAGADRVRMANIQPGGGFADAGALAFGIRPTHLAPLGGDRYAFAAGSGAGTALVFVDTSVSPYVFQVFYFDETIRFLKLVNGKVLVGLGDRLAIVDATSFPPTRKVLRELKLPGGQVNDADVLGDLLSVAAGPGGAVAYRLK